MQIYNQQNHISDEALDLHALNDLPVWERTLVTGHLAACPRCRTRFQDSQEFVQIIRLVAKECQRPAWIPSLAIS